jgi:2-polyprenyl-6-methoxyphenol hydroxylase-like FAD-dependent oxidoreductase
MELLRHAFPPRLGHDMAALLPDRRYWRHFIYTTAVVGGVEIGRVDHFHQSAAPTAPHRLLEAHSPTGVAHLSQKRLMPLLYREAAGGGGGGLSEVHFGWEVQGFEPTTDGRGVRVLAAAAASGRQDGGGDATTRVWEGAYLLAADGASSRIRAQAGVEMVGAAGLQHLMNVHFSSRALADATKHRPAMLYFVYNAEVVCVLVAHRFETGEFVMQLPYFPPVQTPEVRRACLWIMDG